MQYLFFKMVNYANIKMYFLLSVVIILVTKQEEVKQETG